MLYERSEKGMIPKMEIGKAKSIIESILFVAGREVKKEELMSVLEMSSDEVI